jgi:uncharacterized FAD-dependent dehydrogenase
MKKLMVIGLSVISLSSYASVNYQSPKECVQAMNQYINQTANLPDSQSTDYWLWFNDFIMTKSSSKTVCNDGKCSLSIDMGGCGSVGNEILFNLIRPQLDEELNRLETNQNSLKNLKTVVVCNFAQNTTAITEQNCQLK